MHDYGSTNLPNQLNVGFVGKQKLIKPSLDIDILTAIFKVRPQAKNALPTQLNANFNGNIYVGHRTDVYQIGPTPYKLDKPKT